MSNLKKELMIAKAYQQEILFNILNNVEIDDLDIGYTWEMDLLAIEHDIQMIEQSLKWL